MSICHGRFNNPSVCRDGDIVTMSLSDWLHMVEFELSYYGGTLKLLKILKARKETEIFLFYALKILKIKG